MEITLSNQSKSHQFLFHNPTAHILHFSKKEAGLHFPLSLRPFGACDGLHNRLFSSKQTFQINLKLHGNREKIVPAPRTRSSISGEIYDKDKLHRKDRLSRHIVVRSELAGTGSASAAYPLSELQLVPKIRGVCFYAVTSLSAIFLFMLMLVAHPFVLICDRYCRKTHHFVAKIWALWTISPFLKIEFEGLDNLPPPDTPAVYVSNHQSFLDIYTLLTLGRSFKFISKTAIFLFPIIGWAMYFMGVIPLKRMDSRSQLDCLKRCMDLLKKGASVFFFPEGTRSKNGQLGVFKKGAFSVAAKTRVPVVPITLIGTGKIMPAGMESRLNQGSIKVVIHPPIEGKDPDMLCSEARNAIEDGLIHQG